MPRVIQESHDSPEWQQLRSFVSEFKGKSLSWETTDFQVDYGGRCRSADIVVDNLDPVLHPLIIDLNGGVFQTAFEAKPVLPELETDLKSVHATIEQVISTQEKHPNPSFIGHVGNKMSYLKPRLSYNLFGVTKLFQDLQNLAVKHFTEEAREEIILQFSKKMSTVTKSMKASIKVFEKEPLEQEPSKAQPIERIFENLPFEYQEHSLNLEGLQAMLESSQYFDWKGYKKGLLDIKEKYEKDPLATLMPKVSIIPADQLIRKTASQPPIESSAKVQVG